MSEKKAALSKSELAKKLKEKHGLSKGLAEDILGTIEDEMVGAFNAGQKVQLHGFGVFERKMRAAHNGRNPQTGAPMKIAAKAYVSFKAYDALVEKVK